MGKLKAAVIAACACALALALTACGGGTASSSSAASDDGVAGVYTGVYYKFAADPDTAKVTDDPFSLTLNADGTGTHERDDMEFDVTWTLDGEDFRMEEKFLGDPNIYEGTLSGDDLVLYTPGKDDPMAYEYVYTKGDLPVQLDGDPVEDFAVSYTTGQSMAMGNAMGYGLSTVSNKVAYGSFWTSDGQPGLVAREILGEDGSLHRGEETVLDAGCTPNWVNVIDGYAYYLRVADGDDTINRVPIAGGDPEVLVDSNCDYVSFQGDRIYFSDLNQGGGLYSCALDGSDVTLITSHAVVAPYALDADWVLYCDADNGGRLTLHHVPTGYALPISENEAAASLLVGTDLYYVGDNGEGTSVIHKMDMSSYDADEKAFPEEVGTNEVVQPLTTDGEQLLLFCYTSATTFGDAFANWTYIQGPEVGDSTARSYWEYVGPDYTIERDIDASNAATIWCRVTGSAVATTI